MVKTLYVIGNGFDLAHGLETNLCCFKCYLKNKDDESRKFLKSISQYVPFNETWSNFEEALGNIDADKIEEVAMDYAQSPSADDFRDSSWGDPEYEASQAIAFSSEISEYLREWICAVRIDQNYKFPILKDALFLSFNYTNTLEKVYDIPKDKICYIHGDCSKDEVLVCGHNDTSRLKKRIVEESDFFLHNQEVVDIIHGYYEETWKNPEKQINKNKNFFNQLISIQNIVIFGHSFENHIDDDYFIYIKEKVKSSCIWEISYHSELDKIRNEVFAEQLGIKNYSQFSV